MEKLKLYKLILVGQLAINLPIVLLMIGLPTLVFFLVNNLVLKITLIIVLFIVGTITAWFLWSVLITKWRIWAFSQVKNEADMIKLRDLAVKTALIWEDGHKFEMTERGTLKEHIIVDKISNVIHDAEQFEEIKAYVETPSSVGYKISKASILFYLVMEVFILGLAIMSFVMTDKYLFSGIILFIFCLVFWEGKTHKVARYLFSDEYFLIFDPEYLQTHLPEKQQVLWENVIRINIDDDKKNMFIHRIDDGSEPLKINLWTYKISDYKQFEKTIQVFLDRKRAESTA